MAICSKEKVKFAVVISSDPRFVIVKKGKGQDVIKLAHEPSAPPMMVPSSSYSAWIESAFDPPLPSMERGPQPASPPRGKTPKTPASSLSVQLILEGSEVSSAPVTYLQSVNQQGIEEDEEDVEEEREEDGYEAEGDEDEEGEVYTSSFSAGQGNEAALALYFSGSNLDPSLQSSFRPGCVLGDETTSRSFPEAALLGSLAAGEGKGGQVYLNTHEPFCLAAVGVQGGGKSHTMACVLESCLIPFPLGTPAGGVIRLHQPMSVLCLHYDQNVSSVCEATGIVYPSPLISRLLCGQPGQLRGGASRCLPKDRMVILVSPSYYLQRKAFYPKDIIVKPLLFKWSSLTADHIRKIMRIKETDSQLYVAAMLDLLRKYQREQLVPAFPVFLNQVRGLCKVQGQDGPLTQRLRLLESVVKESDVNKGLSLASGDLLSSVKPGVLVVADLTDPLLSSDECAGVFHVLCEQYRSVPASELGGGKLLALDEAHKFMHTTSEGSSGGLSDAIVNVARLMRHDGIRLAVSTQSPLALAPELLELVTVAILHRFHSKDWFTYLSRKLPVGEADGGEGEEMGGHWRQIQSLTPGCALVFSSQHAVKAVQGKSVFQLAIRPRITTDRGASKTNIVMHV